jgi:hypothetical protein
MAGAWYDNDTGIPAEQIDAPAAQPAAAPVASSAAGNWYDNAQGVPAEQVDKIAGVMPAQPPVAPTAATQAKSKVQPASAGNFFDPITIPLAGAANSVADTALGGSQAAAALAHKVGLMPDSTYTPIHEGINDIKQAKDTAAQNMYSENPFGGALYTGGDIAGNAAQYAATSALTPIKAAGTAAEAIPIIGKTLGKYLPSALSGAITSGAQPVQDESERGINAGIGAATSVAGQKIGNVLSTQVTDPAKQAALKTAEEFNIPVYRSQVSDSPLVQAAASVEKNIPGSGAGSKLDAQTMAFNKAVNGRLGVDSTTLDRNGDPLGAHGNIVGPEALDAADHQISQTYNKITGKYNLTANQPFNDALNDIEKDGTENLVDSKASAFKQQINNIRNKIVNAASGAKSAGNGIIPGQIYQNLRSNISGIMRSGNGSPQLGKVLNLLDTQMAKGMTPDDASAFQAVRGQYKNMLVAEKAIKIDPNNPVTPARIAQGARNAFSDYAYGSKSDFAQLGRLGSMLTDKGANTSKTAVHNQFYDVIKHGIAPAIGAGVGAGEGYHEGGIAGGLTGAAVGATSALVGNRFGLAPYLYSKMSANPSIAQQFAAPAASGVTNAFLDLHKKQTNQ